METGGNMTGNGNRTDQVILALLHNQAINNLLIDYLYQVNKVKIDYYDFLTFAELHNQPVSGENFKFNQIGKKGRTEITDYMQDLYWEQMAEFDIQGI